MVVQESNPVHDVGYAMTVPVIQPVEVTNVLLTTTPDARLIVVLAFKFDGRCLAPVARVGATGEWLADLVDVLGGGVLSFALDRSYLVDGEFVDGELVRLWQTDIEGVRVSVDLQRVE